MDEAASIDKLRKLVIEKTFNATAAKLWDAWTVPEQLSQWWAPDMFSISRCELDVKPGGRIRIDMQGPDGTIYPMTAIYEEVDKQNKLVFISEIAEKGQVVFRVEQNIDFHNQGNETKLSLLWEVTFMTKEAMPYLSGMEAGLNQSLEKLQKFLES